MRVCNTFCGGLYLRVPREKGDYSEQPKHNQGRGGDETRFLGYHYRLFPGVLQASYNGSGTLIKIA